VAAHVVLVWGKALEQRLAPLHVVHDAVPRVARHVEEEALGKHDLLVAPTLVVQHKLVKEPVCGGRESEKKDKIEGEKERENGRKFEEVNNKRLKNAMLRLCFYRTHSPCAWAVGLAQGQNKNSSKSVTSTLSMPYTALASNRQCVNVCVLSYPVNNEYMECFLCWR